MTSFFQQHTCMENWEFLLLSFFVFFSFIYFFKFEKYRWLKQEWAFLLCEDILVWHSMVTSKIKHSLLPFLQFTLKQVMSSYQNISPHPYTEPPWPTSIPACLLSTWSVSKLIHVLSPPPSPTLNICNDFYTKNGKNPLQFHDFTEFFASYFQ